MNTKRKYEDESVAEPINIYSPVVSSVQRSDDQFTKNVSEVSVNITKGNPLTRKLLTTEKPKKHKKMKKKQQKQPPKPPPVLCKFYTNGACTKGKECTFAHVGEIIKKNEICKFIKSNSCRKAGECPYSHDLSKEACIYFLEGTCTAGIRCKYGHFVPEKEAVVKEEEDLIPPEVGQIQTTFKEEKEFYQEVESNPFAPLQPITTTLPKKSITQVEPIQSHDVNCILANVLKNK